MKATAQRHAKQDVKDVKAREVRSKGNYEVKGSSFLEASEAVA